MKPIAFRNALCRIAGRPIDGYFVDINDSFYVSYDKMMKTKASMNQLTLFIEN